MIPAQFDFLLWQNSDYSEHILVTNNTISIDMSNVIVRMDIRESANGPIVASKTLVTDDSGFFVEYVHNEIAKIGQKGSIFVHDIIVIHGDSKQEIYAQGIVQINNGVTQNG